MAEQLAELNKGEPVFRFLEITGRSASFPVSGEQSVTFDFSSQMKSGEKILSASPNSTGVAGLCIRIINVHSDRNIVTVVWRNTTTSAINANALGCQAVVARF